KILESCLKILELIGPRLYSCCNCRNHVSLHDDIISKAFQGRNGRAFLFSHAMNIVIGPKEDRHLMTGLHTVADIYCADCHEVFGWKYERAYEATQKYKEGKFILEKSKIVLYILLNIGRDCTCIFATLISLYMDISFNGLMCNLFKHARKLILCTTKKKFSVVVN
ncbi:protein yippee-like, partial [Quercus suber]